MDPRQIQTQALPHRDEKDANIWNGLLASRRVKLWPFPLSRTHLTMGPQDGGHRCISPEFRASHWRQILLCGTLLLWSKSCCYQLSIPHWPIPRKVLRHLEEK
ncbi:hypothetical protein GN956_G3848 [Arapaima gigas]